MILGIMNNLNTMNNAAYRMMSTNNAMMRLTSSAPKFGNLNYVSQQENRLMTDKLNSELVYKINEQQLKAQEKIEKENIKRTFSTFA